MRKTLLIALSLTLTITMVKAQAPATIRLTDVTLMHEMREAAIPENKGCHQRPECIVPMAAPCRPQDARQRAKGTCRPGRLEKSR